MRRLLVIIFLVASCGGTVVPSRAVPEGTLGSPDQSPTSTASPAGVVTSSLPASPSSGPSIGATATARLADLCELLSVDEVKKATGTRWEIVAEAGSFLDGDRNCRYLATGDAPLNPDGTPIAVVVIEELVAPTMVRYWNGSAGRDVPVSGAAARWVKGEAALGTEGVLGITKGDRIFTVTFLAEGAQVPGHATPPPPAGGFEAAAIGILQTMVDRLP